MSRQNSASGNMSGSDRFVLMHINGLEHVLDALFVNYLLLQNKNK